MNVATTSTFSTVACRSGQFQDFSRIEIPNGDIKTFTVFAPLIQLNFQSSDLPATSSAAETAGGGGGASPSSTGQSLPSITGMSGSSTASDPVASLIPSSLRTSATALGPFTPQAQPLICNDAGGGVIDASGYDDGVNRWILWKVDGNSLGGATTCQGDCLGRCIHVRQGSTDILLTARPVPEHTKLTAVCGGR